MLISIIFISNQIASSDWLIGRGSSLGPNRGQNNFLVIVSLSLIKTYIIIIVCIADFRSDLKMLIYRTAIPP